MKLRIKAILSLRWNYKWRGVWVWLKGRHCWSCGGTGKVRSHPQDPTGELIDLRCLRCNGKPKRGYHRILSEPQRVLDEQTAIAEGVMG